MSLSQSTEETQVTASLNLDETQEWLEILHGDSPGLLNICSTLDWRGRFFYATTEIEPALEYIEALDAKGAEGIYLRATTLKTRPETGRGGDDLSLMLPGLWADIDLAGPGHKTKGILPGNVGEAMAIVEASGLPEPSHWIHSGGGLYPWWLLREAVEIDDTETFRALSSGWQKVIELASKKLGFTYGSGVGDLSRVLRIPGTINRKAGLARACTGLQGHAWSGPTYALSDLISALDAATPPPPAPSKLEIKQTTTSDGLRPGDDFERQVTWHDLLLPLGWQWVYKRGDKWHLRRPGKTTGTSATLSDTTGNLFIFSEECYPLESFRHYSKFAFYTYTEHGGNFREATKDLSAKGYGTPLERSSPPSGNRLLLETSETMEVPSTPDAPAGQAISDTTAGNPSAKVNWTRDFGAPELTVDEFLAEDFTLHGAGMLFAKAYENTFKYCETDWWFWTGRIWKRDKRSRFEDAAKAIIDIGRVAAREATARGDDYAKALTAHVRKLSNTQSPAIPRWGRSDPRISMAYEDFDAQAHLVALDNGCFNLDTMTLEDHDPRNLVTRAMPVAYDKDATCPQWEGFLAQAVPDPEIRSYLQKAMGHTILGDAEQRALFLLHGPSGTGKSQFIRMMELLFGDFAETATPATFNGTSKTATLTNDLNDLKGKRFVSLSELDEGEILNESLVKRLTGGDTAKSRGLWQENSKWRVQFTLWLATNNLPRLNSDDNAIWRRVKPIHFPHVAEDNGGEVLRLAEKIFASESAGILNWVLAGVEAYRLHGLADPQTVKEAVAAYRKEVDVVEQFMAQALEEGTLVAVEGTEIASQRLHGIFLDWCIKNNVKAQFTNRRFSQRLDRMGYQKKRTNTAVVWVGIDTGNNGLLGTMYPRRN